MISKNSHDFVPSSTLFLFLSVILEIRVIYNINNTDFVVYENTVLTSYFINTNTKFPGSVNFSNISLIEDCSTDTSATIKGLCWKYS